MKLLRIRKALKSNVFLKSLQWNYDHSGFYMGSYFAKFNINKYKVKITIDWIVGKHDSYHASMIADCGHGQDKERLRFFDINLKSVEDLEALPKTIEQAIRMLSFEKTEKAIVKPDSNNYAIIKKIELENMSEETKEALTVMCKLAVKQFENNS
jgi:hypothetical protein